MEARLLNSIVIIASICSLGASARTANFIVDASTPGLAREVAQSAEQYRKQLAIDWLGKELPRWTSPCPIKVTDGENLGAGGATTFRFDGGRVFGWNMSIQGSKQRILDSVLPHEITHTIFASHFRAPLPRWADEGACTTVEHISERKKQDRMLIHFLKNERGIALDRMFAMKEYPRDIMPLYAQGYSLSKMLLAQGGKKAFINFVDTGMRSNNWPTALKQHYGYNNLRELQTSWVSWVRQGSPMPLPTTVKAKNSATASLASVNTTPVQRLKSRPTTNIIYRNKTQVASNRNTNQMKDLVGLRQSNNSQASPSATANNNSTEGWYSRHKSRQMVSQANVKPNPNRTTSAANSATQHVTRPQPIQQSRQVILQWERNQPPASSSNQSYYQSQQIPAVPNRRY